MACEMNGVRKLRVIADMEYSLVLSCELKDLADKIEREHMDEINVYRENEARLINRIERLRKAIEDAPKQDADREAAAGRVEEHGGLVAVQERICSSARMLYSVDSIVCGDEQHCFGERVDLGEADELFGVIYGELDKRLMPPGMEWPKDRNENPFDPRKLYDSGCGAVDFVRIGFVNGEQWASVVSHDGNDLFPEELGDCEPEVLGADGLPIKVGETVYLISGSEPYRVECMPYSEGGMLTVYGLESKREKLYRYYPYILTHTPPDTQKRIYDDVYKISDACTYFSSDGSCAKCKFVSQYGDADSAYEACPLGDELDRMVVLDLLRWYSVCRSGNDHCIASCCCCRMVDCWVDSRAGMK